MDAALLGSMWTGGLGVLTLVISRIRCLYKRDEEGHCGPCVCGCTEKALTPDTEWIETKEIEIGDHHAVPLLPKK